MNINTKKAALYVRVSTNYQVDKDSLPFQRKELKDYAKFALGIEDVELFEDAGYSGKNTDRPAYQRMMEKCRNGEITHIIVWKIDRISRNLLDFAGMYEELKKYNITFVSKNEQFDTSSAMGEAMLKIILIFAELERKLTSERVSAIMMDRAKKGLWNGARMPIGYRWNEDTKYPEVDPEEASTVKFIFDEYERCNSTNAISRLLNNNSIKTKRSGEWTSKTVADVLRNPFYKGTYRYNYRHSARGSKKPESEWIVIENNHTALIDLAQWEKVNKIMDVHNESKNTSEFRGVKHFHMFSGLLKCGLCGYNFISSRVDKPRLNGFTPTTYVCSKKQRSSVCNNKFASDVVVGPFVINYLANLLKAQRNINTIAGLPKLSKVLLTGECFDEVKYIDNDGLQALYNSMIYKSLSYVEYDPKIDSTTDQAKGSEFELASLHKEKEKNERALQRLKQLFLFDDTVMSEDEYIKSQKEITDKLNEILTKINTLEKDRKNIISGADISFIQKASQFIVTQKLLSKKYINYPELCLTTDKQIIREFVMSTIDSIHVSNAKVTRIDFKNGLVHKFIY